MFALLIPLLLTMDVNHVNAAGHHIIVEKMLEAFIVPEVLKKPAPDLLNVTYGNITIEPGQYVYLENITEPPNVSWHCYPPAYYSLFLTDIDHDRYFDEDFPEHIAWYVYDIINCTVSTGVVKLPYDVMHRPSSKGHFRHLWAVFEQPEKFSTKRGLEFQNLLRWNARIRLLVEDYKLIGPVAANFAYVINNPLW